MDQQSQSIFRKLLDRAKAKSNFKTFQSHDHHLFQILENFFVKNIQPVYGDQRSTLNKIREGKDRTCEFLYHNEKPVGIIVYKNKLCNEFLEYGIQEGFELKTVLVLDPNKKDVGMFLCRLLSQAAKRAIAMKAKCIVGTVSDQRLEVLNILCRLGFKVVQIFPGKYIPNVDEYVVCHSFLANLLEGNKLDPITQKQEISFVSP